MLEELKMFFTNSSYPESILEEIISKVKSTSRSLEYRISHIDNKNLTPWVMTHGAAYNETRNKLHGLNETLSNSRTWNEEPQNNIPLFRMVTRRAANLKDILYRRRALTSGSSSKITEPCTKPGENRKGRRYQTCNLISQKSSVTRNQITVLCRRGNCKTNK